MEQTEKHCGSCGRKLKQIKQTKIQLGEYGALLRNVPNLIAGALAVEVWRCPSCGKLEFYQAWFQTEEEDEGEYKEGHMAQTMCPDCGRSHDLDDPKCPFCGAKNPQIYYSNKEDFHGLI